MTILYAVLSGNFFFCAPNAGHGERKTSINLIKHENPKIDLQLKRDDIGSFFQFSITIHIKYAWIRLIIETKKINALLIWQEPDSRHVYTWD